MATAVIADAHLAGPGGAPEPLVQQLETLSPPGCERLILLGDLFQAWIGNRRFETPEIALVVSALRRLRGRGVGVDYVEGNRDFFLGDGPYGELFDSVSRELAFEVGGRRYLAVHGDGLNDRDYLYRFWRWASKNRASRLGMELLPRALARRFVERTERGLAKTNFKHKREIPEAVLLDFARPRLAAGVDVVLFGHFHEPRCWRLPEGEVFILDAWFRSRRIEWLPLRSPAAV